MAGLIIYDNGREDKKITNKSADCSVCTHPEEERTDLEKIFNLLEKEKDEEGMNLLYNEKICAYHKDRFNSIKVMINRTPELFLYEPKNTSSREKEGVAVEITEDEYNKEAEEGDEEDPDYQHKRERAD